jgi:hypothetical protein
MARPECQAARATKLEVVSVPTPVSTAMCPPRRQFSSDALVGSAEKFHQSETLYDSMYLTLMAVSSSKIELFLPENRFTPASLVRRMDEETTIDKTLAVDFT